MLLQQRHVFGSYCWNLPVDIILLPQLIYETLHTTLLPNVCNNKDYVENYTKQCNNKHSFEWEFLFSL